MPAPFDAELASKWVQILDAYVTKFWIEIAYFEFQMNDVVSYINLDFAECESFNKNKNSYTKVLTLIRLVDGHLSIGFLPVGK